MKSAKHGDHSQRNLPVAAIVVGAFAAFVTAGTVSQATPDGNLVVTLVLALAVCLAVFGLVLWRLGRRESE